MHTLLMIVPFYTVTLGFYIDIFLIWHFKNCIVFYSQGYSSHVRYNHIKTQIVRSQFHINCLYIYFYSYLQPDDGLLG